MSDDLQREILSEVDGLCHLRGQVLFEREKKILDLYNEQQEVRLEVALLNAQNKLSNITVADAEVPEQLRIAEQQVIEARASYMLRNKIIQDVIITDPILKAVHGGSYATPIERNLLPLVNARDGLSMLQSQLATNLREMHSRLSDVQRANIVATQKNRELTQRLLDLVEQTTPTTRNEVQDPQVRAHLTGLEQEIRPLKREWRVLKCLLAGLIVGSGVDWARDPALLDLVLDNEDEMT